MADKVFGGLKPSANGPRIHTGSSISTSDATTVAQDSPLAYTTANLTLAIPTNAAEVSLRPSTDLRVSANSDPAGGDSYFVMEAGERIVIGVANIANLYVAGNASAGTLQFYFITV
jgi:hypothetical protein